MDRRSFITKAAAAVVATQLPTPEPITGEYTTYLFEDESYIGVVDAVLESHDARFWYTPYMSPVFAMPYGSVPAQKEFIKLFLEIKRKGEMEIAAQLF